MYEVNRDLEFYNKTGMIRNAFRKFLVYSPTYRLDFVNYISSQLNLEVVQQASDYSVSFNFEGGNNDETVLYNLVNTALISLINRSDFEALLNYKIGTFTAEDTLALLDLIKDNRYVSVLYTIYIDEKRNVSIIF